MNWRKLSPLQFNPIIGWANKKNEKQWCKLDRLVIYLFTDQLQHENQNISLLQICFTLFFLFISVRHSGILIDFFSISLELFFALWLWHKTAIWAGKKSLRMLTNLAYYHSFHIRFVLFSHKICNIIATILLQNDERSCSKKGIHSKNDVRQYLLFIEHIFNQIIAFIIETWKYFEFFCFLNKRWFWSLVKWQKKRLFWRSILFLSNLLKQRKWKDIKWTRMMSTYVMDRSQS